MIVSVFSQKNPKNYSAKKRFGYIVGKGDKSMRK
jgi:hypothetical protein